MSRESPKPGYGGAFIGKIQENASIELDEKHCAAIGKVAAAWSLLEYALDFAIVHLSSSGKEQGYCVTSQIMSASYKMRAFISLMEFHGLKGKDKVKAFQQKIYDLVDKRNRVIHDVWIKDSKTQEHFRHQMVDKQGSLMLENVPVDLTKIDKLVAEITKLRKDFVNFWMRLPSPNMFPSTSILLQ